MGMGNDGIDVSNSLDTCTHFNNSGIRDANSAKDIDALQDQCATRNIDDDQNIDSSISGVQEKDHNDTENMNIEYKTSTPTEQAQSAPGGENRRACEGSQDRANEDEGREEKPIDSDCSEDKDKEEGNAGPSTGSECQDEASKGDVETLDMEPTPNAPYRNNSLLQVSHLKRAWGGKRVTDIRSVSELLETFYSLEEPIITPIPRQHEYYDQWARIPCCDVIQRLYPRVNSCVSAKRWALFQTIQSDQAKSPAAATSPASSPQKLAPPPNGEVICKSLDSIIEHYNQMIHNAQPETHPKASPPATPSRRRPTSHQTHSHGATARGSLGHGPRGTGPQPLKEEEVTLKTPTPKSKISPSTPKKVKQQEGSSSTNSTLAARKGEASKKAPRAKKCPFPDYELTVNEAPDSLLTNAPVIDKSHSRHPSHVPAVPAIPQGSKQAEPWPHHDPVSNRNTSSPTNAERVVSPDQGSLNAKTSGDSGGRDPRNPLDINTNTLSLSLPHEQSNSGAETQRNSPSPGGKFKMSPSIVDGSPETKNISEKHERFPLRSTAFVSRGKRAKTTLEYTYKRITSLKNVSRSIATPLHNVQDLKDSLLIHEMNCESDMKPDRRKWDQPPKSNGNGSRQRVKQALHQHECKPMAPQLPARMHTMLERLNAERPSPDQLSPGTNTPPSRGNSAVSLASVHFLDLADLKNFLKKSNTTLHYL